jgi:HD superfamily phosphohydrolase
MSLTVLLKRRVLKMKSISKVLSIILLLTFSVVINQCASNQKTDIKPVSFIEKTPEAMKKIYFKDGSVIKCNIAWEGMESQIICKKSDDILAYSADEVDLEKTFGKTDGKEITERYERMKRERELMSEPAIVTPEEERNMRRAEGERLERAKKYKGLIELEKRLLKDKLKRFKEKYRTASGPPPKGYSGFNEKEYYKGLIESTEKKIEELEREPELYFYGKNQQRAERSKRVKHDTDDSVKLPNTGKFGSDGTFYAPIGDGGLINTKTGEIIN